MAAPADFPPAWVTKQGLIATPHLCALAACSAACCGYPATTLASCVKITSAADLAMYSAPEVLLPLLFLLLLLLLPQAFGFTVSTAHHPLSR